MSRKFNGPIDTAGSLIRAGDEVCGRQAAANDSERVCGGGSIRGRVRATKLVGGFVQVSVLNKYFSGSLLFGSVGAGYGCKQLLGDELPYGGIGGAGNLGAAGTTRDEISHLTEYVVQLRVHGKQGIGLRRLHIVRIGLFNTRFYVAAEICCQLQTGP